MTYKRLNFIIAVFLLCAFLIWGCRHAADLPKNQFRVAVFKDQGFPSVGTPLTLTPEWLYKSISKDFSVTYLNSEELADREHLNINTFDLLIMPYGEAFPYKSFENIKEYIFQGGGIFNISGRPFWTPMENPGGGWQKIGVKDPYKSFLSHLGIKYYEAEDTQDIGLSVTTSLGFNPVRPTHGNVFPYRIPARDFSKNKEGMVFVKSWKNPYIKSSDKIPNKWCLIGSVGEQNPLNPKNPDAQKNLADVIKYLSFPLVMYELESNFAGYYQGETVEVSVKVINIGKIKKPGVIEIEFLDQENKVIHASEKRIELQPEERATFKVIWRPENFKSSFYVIKASLKENNITLDTEENGFVVIDKEVLKKGPSISIDKNHFVINNKESFLLGVNYYESKLGELMWLKPNLSRIREDFKSMRNLGINFVRIHYHHSKWFRDYFSQVVKEPLGRYFQEVDTEPLPSERSLRILDAIIQLSQEQGLIFCMDLFSLVPEEMGNPKGWLGLRERIADKDKISVQKEFVKIISQRYKDVPGITWDLWNEPRLEKEDLGLLKTWAQEIIYSFRENGDTHPITIGGDSTVELLDVIDYACAHTYEPGEFDFKGLEAKPVLFQETWNVSGMSLNEEIKQRQELAKDFRAFLNTGAAGFAPWQWTRQARLWNNASEAEKWDDDLGLCVHEDGSFKPAGTLYRELILNAGRDK